MMAMMTIMTTDENAEDDDVEADDVEVGDIEDH